MIPKEELMIKRIKSEYAETTQVPLYNSLNSKGESYDWYKI